MKQGRKGVAAQKRDVHRFERDRDTVFLYLRSAKPEKERERGRKENKGNNKG